MTTISNLFIRDFETKVPVPVKLIVSDENITIIFLGSGEEDEVASVMVESLNGRPRLLYWKQSDNYASEEPMIVNLSKEGDDEKEKP